MKFSEIVGHQGIKSRLVRMVDEGCCPHALLLSGPSGTGKLGLAMALTQYMHCRNRAGGDSCGECDSCIQHARMGHPDTHFVFPIVKRKGEGKALCTDYLEEWRRFMAEGRGYGLWEDWLEACGAGNSQPLIYVEESNELVRRMHLSNYSAEYKVAIIWLPEKLKAEAANKLLKILEEPYSDTRFILVSDDASGILPTVRSRTQEVEVRAEGEEVVAAALSQLYGVDTGVGRSVAARAAGRLGVAVGLLQAGGEREEFAPLFREMMRKAWGRDVRGLYDIAEQTAGMGREKCRRFLEYCQGQIRDNFLLNLGMVNLTGMDRGELEFGRKFARFVHSGNVEAICRLFEQAAEDVARNAAAKIVMFDVMLQMAVQVRRQPVV